MFNNYNDFKQSISVLHIVMATLLWGELCHMSIPSLQQKKSVSRVSQTWTDKGAMC